MGGQIWFKSVPRCTGIGTDNRDNASSNDQDYLLITWNLEGLLMRPGWIGFEDPPQTSDRASIDWVSTGACFLFASLGPFLFGVDIGVSPAAVAAVTSEALTREDW